MAVSPNVPIYINKIELKNTNSFECQANKYIFSKNSKGKVKSKIYIYINAAEY
jgi:hypothetical protein